MFFLWLGLITLIISSCILVITIEPFFTADSIDDIKNDWDENSGTFKSHKKGDRLKVSGKIIGVIETKNLLEENESVSDELLTESFGAKYIYVIEDQNFEVYSNEKIGNKGDYIILECEVDEVILNRWGQITDEKEVLKVKSHFNPFFPLIIEIALILISIFVIIKLITKRKALIKAESTPFQLAALYDEAKTDDEEKTLYEFMKAKKQVKVTQPIQPTKKISSFKVFQRQLRSKSPSGSKTKTTSKFSIFHMQSFSRPTSRSNQMNKKPAQGLTLSVTPQEFIQANGTQSTTFPSQQELKSTRVSGLYKYLKEKDDELVLYQSMQSPKDKAGK